MKKFNCLIIIAVSIFISACQSTSSRVVTPPNGGASVTVHSPIWISGIEDPINTKFTNEYPAAEESLYIKVVNAGFKLANAYGKTSQLIYEFQVNFNDLPEAKLFTRVTFDNPEDTSKPFIYEHSLGGKDRSTKSVHGPLSNIKLGERYNFKFEVFTDEARSILFDKVEQSILSAVDNSSGCVELENEYKQQHFGALPGQGGGLLPLDKIIVYCEV